MRFRFDPNQEHQLRALESVARLFEGQPRQTVELEFAPGGGFAAVGNRLDLTSDALLANLRQVERWNAIPEDAELEWIEEPSDLAGGGEPVGFPNFTVEMETGTGKTYTYIRTALELHRRYGFRKFIIVVPFVAIREGVLKTFRMTEEHLRNLYENTPYRYTEYDSGNLAQVRNFALSDSLEFLVMTLASFNKAMSERSAGNVIYRPDDRLQGETPVELVRLARPILILDEPQNMESEKSVRALASLNPLLALRYSATHRNPYNLVYRLTPYEAYRRGLVKRVEVAGVEEDAAGRPFMRLERIEPRKRSITARLAVQKLRKDATSRAATITVRDGDDLEAATENPAYRDLRVEEINAREDWIRLADGTRLSVGEVHGPDREAIFDGQIRYTIREHMRKQERLRERGVKVLSLFFIDRVANYAEEDGIIRRLFARAFDELKQDFPAWEDREAEEVQAAYFAARRNRAGETILEDSKTGEAQRDREAYDLIMRDKEALLSFRDPGDDPEAQRKKRVSFIFSHTALREGWDNPNLFQICTLNESVSEMRKRQEIGRGIRLAVDQSGQRVHDDQVNVLTVVANESYEDFVAQYQRELDEEFGTGEKPPKPDDARAKRTVRLRERTLDAPEFKELWERIKQRTRYRVTVDADSLTEDVAARLEDAEVRAPRIQIRTAELVAPDREDRFDHLLLKAESKALSPSRDGGAPDLVRLVLDLLQETSPPVSITRETALACLRRLPREKMQRALESPTEFATVAVQVVRRVLADQLVEGIEYRGIDGGYYEMSQFVPEFEAADARLVHVQRSIYDQIPVDSKVERDFVTGLERWKAVRLVLKLPAWFTIDTPIGSYNPDWALVVAPGDGDGMGEERLYLIRETKGSNYPDGLRPDEARKIYCAERHFEYLGVDFGVATDVEDLVDQVMRRS